MNALYEESEEQSWDLRCSAEYDSDFYTLTKQHCPSCFSEPSCVYSEEIPPSRCHKPRSPRRCPRVDDRVVLSSWYVYEDRLYYSYDGSSWRDSDPVSNHQSISASHASSSSTASTNEHSTFPHSIQLVLNGANFEVPATSLSELLSLMNIVNRAPQLTESVQQRDERIQAKRALRKLLQMETEEEEPTPTAEQEWSFVQELAGTNVTVICRLLQECVLSDDM